MHLIPLNPFTPQRLATINKINFEYLVLLKDISVYCNPTKRARITIRMFFRCLFFSTQTIAWFKFIANSPLLSQVIQFDRCLAERYYRPNLRADYSIDKRLKILTEHYSYIDKLLTGNLLKQVILGDGLILANITTPTEALYRLKLCYGLKGSKEGELSFVMSDFDNQQLCRLSFSVIPTQQSHTIYIGGLQGPSKVSAQQIVNKACRDCYDLTPKRITMEMLWVFAKCTGATQILGVPNQQHVFSHRGTKYFNYDEYWLSLNAMVNEEGDFILPLEHVHKELADVKRKRRAKYRKQRELLEIISADALNALKD